MFAPYGDGSFPPYLPQASFSRQRLWMFAPYGDG